MEKSLNAPLDIARPEPVARQNFTDAEAAVAALKALYHRNAGFLRDAFARFVSGQDGRRRYRATYPELSIETTSYAEVDSRLAFGHVAAPGRYATTITRPDLFES